MSNIVFDNVMMADRLYAGLPSVIYSNTSPAEALVIIAQDTPSVIPWPHE